MGYPIFLPTLICRGDILFRQRTLQKTKCSNSSCLVIVVNHTNSMKKKTSLKICWVWAVCLFLPKVSAFFFLPPLPFPNFQVSPNLELRDLPYCISWVLDTRHKHSWLVFPSVVMEITPKILTHARKAKLQMSYRPLLYNSSSLWICYVA